MSRRGLYYLVNKTKNDKWLTSGARIYTYRDRPWATAHASLIEAISAATVKTVTRDWEIEAPNGNVYGFVKGCWEIVFN